MKQFITYIPTFGTGQAKAHDGATLLRELTERFPQFAGQIEVREASEKPVLVADVTEEELV